MKRLLSFAISAALLALIYWRVDIRALFGVFRLCDPLWMALGLGMVVPLTLGTAWRLRQLLPPTVRLSWGEANRLILAASVLNLVLPSKMGDLAKAWWMRERGHLSGGLALALVVFEKSCDMLSLLVWCAFGLILYPDKSWLFWTMTVVVAAGLAAGLLLIGSVRFAGFFFDTALRCAPVKMRGRLASLHEAWREMHGYFWQSPSHLLRLAGSSLLLWFLHLAQIWIFVLALRAWVPFTANLALAPLALLAGLLPLTFAGIGTRDAALLYFYQAYLSPATAAALGLLCTARYILPALGGWPFATEYLSKVRRAGTSD